jgi:hypothetical protein
VVASRVDRLPLSLPTSLYIDRAIRTNESRAAVMIRPE